MFCSCTPAIYKVPQQAFSPHISRGYIAHQNSQPVKKHKPLLMEQLQPSTNCYKLSVPINSGAPSSAICSVTAFPQSPPCATNRVYPRRFISTTRALAMRMGSQPSSVGAAENPWPGSDGITTSNASEALPPCAVGFVSG